jgi:hypothetical protein
VRSRGDKNYVAVGRMLSAYGELLKQLMALVSTPACIWISGTGVRFVDDDQLGSGADELVAPGVALDEVCRDDRVRKHVENGLVRAAVSALKAPCGTREDQFGVEVELGR